VGCPNERTRERFIRRATWASDEFPAGFRGEAASGLQWAAFNLSDFPNNGTGRDGCEMRLAAPRIASALVVRGAVLAEVLAAV
jgi:hypothetical protein